MTDKPPHEAPPERELTGPGKDFAAFAELERERRRSSLKDFDPELFEEAVALVLGKLRRH